MSAEEIIKILAELGRFYWSEAGVRRKETFQELAIGDWKTALVYFMKGYAFERAGRSPIFPKAAADSIQAYEKDLPGADFEIAIWTEFLRRINDGGQVLNC